MTTSFRPDTGERGRDTRQRTANDVAHGRRLPMRADNPTDLAKQVRRALWKFASRTSARGVFRDRQALALVRGRFPAAAAVLPDSALAAVIREPGPGMCSWCAFRALSAASNEPTPTPTAPLQALRRAVPEAMPAHLRRPTGLPGARRLGRGGRRPASQASLRPGGHYPQAGYGVVWESEDRGALVAVTVTRQRLAAPPEQPASSAPSVAATVATDPAVEARRARDCVRLAGYMAARATQRRSAAQIAVGTGLPISRILQALDTLTACGFLTRAEPRRTPTGGWVPTWARFDPPGRPEGQP